MTNRFKTFLEPGAITINTWMPRRISHSVSDWFRAQMGYTWGDNAKAAAESALTSGVGTAGTAVALFTGLAATTVGAAIAAPITASVAGIIGLGFMTKSACSNRDEAHNKLLPFVWNLIDAKGPGTSLYTSPDNLKKAAEQANYIITESSSQFKTMGTKLELKQNELNSMWIKYETLVAPLVGQEWVHLQRSMKRHRGRSAQRKLDYTQSILAQHAILNSASVSGGELIIEHSKENGAIWEYMRRLIKVGNYLQCADIVSFATYTHLQTSPSESEAGKDPFLNWEFAKTIRANVLGMSDLVDSVELNYQEWVKFLRENNISAQ
jgi:hypothetical protein